jgi:DNA-binding transcriptional LysR family regulator
MEFRRLRYFVAVAEDLHFTQAANRLRVAQPHLSQEIRKLEREIGTHLFVRTKRSVTLTPAGRVFLERVRGIFDSTADAVNAAQRASRGETGKLSVGFVSAAAYTVIPDAIVHFRQAYPNVELVLGELNSDEGVEAVRKGMLDVCLLHPPRNLDPAFAVEIVWAEPLAVALPGGHAAAAKARVSLGKLKNESWVLWQREIASRLYDEVMAACRAAGFEPRVAQRTERLATVLSLVGSGVGLALVPEAISRVGVRGAVFRPLAGPRVTVPMALVWRKGDVLPALAPFAAAIKDARAQMSAAAADS